MQEFILFQGNDEMIVTTPAQEAATIEIYFTKGGRDMDDYDRTVSFEEAILVTSQLTRQW